MDKEYEYDLFRFIELPETYTPEWLYLSPAWLRPFSDKREHSLLFVCAGCLLFHTCLEILSLYILICLCRTIMFLRLISSLKMY